MDRDTARDDLSFIRGILERTERTVDPHAFHYVSWGAIVLIWYPLANWFELRGDFQSMAAVGITSVALGIALSCLLSWRRCSKQKLPGENTFVSRQVGMVTAGALVAAIVLSAVGPATSVTRAPSAAQADAMA